MSAVNPADNARLRRCWRVLLALALLVFVWRLLDFIDEALTGAMKMTLGPWVLTGPVATLAQLGVLLLMAVLIRKLATSRAPAISPGQHAAPDSQSATRSPR